jgi:hypothetical protein
MGSERCGEVFQRQVKTTSDIGCIRHSQDLLQSPEESQQTLVHLPIRRSWCSCHPLISRDDPSGPTVLSIEGARLLLVGYRVVQTV